MVHPLSSQKQLGVSILGKKEEYTQGNKLNDMLCKILAEMPGTLVSFQ